MLQSKKKLNRGTCLLQLLSKTPDASARPAFLTRLCFKACALASRAEASQDLGGLVVHGMFQIVSLLIQRIIKD
jgi:hypothetical protein